jgi:hypothetical protein
MLKRLFGESAGPFVPGLFSVGSWFVSQFFEVPFNAGIFRAGAILGMLAGYALGNVCAGGAAVRRRRLALTIGLALSIVGAFVVGVVVMVDYYYLVGEGQATNSQSTTVRAVAELALVFACAGYSMPIAGITFAKPAESEDTEGDATKGENGVGSANAGH